MPSRDRDLGWPKPDKLKVGSVTATGSVDAYDVEEVNATSGAITRTLPLAANRTGFTFVFKKVDSSENTVTIARAGSDTLDGQTSVVLYSQYETVKVISNGTGWSVFYG